MSEFVVSARLLADASGLKAGAGEGVGALQRLRGAGDEVSASSARLRSETAATTSGMGHLTRGLQQVVAGARAQKAALDASTKAVREKQAATRMAGIQFGDFTQSITMGINPAQAFAQQIGQMGMAFEGMGGKVGRVGAFLMGPWGAAVALAGIGLGVLTEHLFRTGEQSKRTRDATDIHKMSLEELTRATREQSEAARQAIRTSREAEEQALATAQAHRQEVLNRRQVIVAALEQAQLRLVEARARERDPTLAGEGGFNPGSAASAMYSAQQRELTALLGQAHAALRIAERGVTAAQVPLVRRNAEAAVDPQARISDRYDRAVAAATQSFQSQIQHGTRREQAERSYQAALEAARRARNAQTEALQEANRESRRSTSTSLDLTEFQQPIAGGRIGSRMGPRWGRQHNGIDIPTAVGTSVRAAAPGTVLTIGNDPGGYGRFMIVDHGGGTTTRYAHLLRTTAREGQRVSAGTQIALSGGARGGDGAGNSRGPHLHYEVRQSGRAIDPTRGRYRTDSAATAERAEDIADRADAERIRELDQDLQGITRSFGAATAVAREYEQALAAIGRLEEANRITAQQAGDYRAQALQQALRATSAAQQAEMQRLAALIPNDGLREAVDAIPQAFGDGMRAAAREAAEELERRGTEAVDAIASLLGNRMGRITSGFGDLMFARAEGGRVQANSFGGLGGLVNLFRAERTPGQVRMMTDEQRSAAGDDPYAFNPLLDGLREVFDPMRDGIRSLMRTMNDLFGGNGGLAKALGKAAGFAFVGGSVASMIGGSGLGGSVGGVAGGMLGQMAGKAIGGMLGQAAGPLGSILGGLVGGTLGNVLKGSQRGAATISGLDGVTTRGNSGSRIAAASGLAKGVQGALQQIVDELGGTVGAFAGSIAQKDNKFFVDPTGKGRTKGAGVQKFATQDEAAAALLADAISDGAIQGISTAVRAALGSSPDVQKAVREAMKVEEVESVLQNLGSATTKQLRDFERQAQERVRIARQYGFDVVKIEEMNAKERLALVDQLIASRVGGLKDLLADIEFGDLFEGSIVDRIAKLAAELEKAAADAGAGVDGAADKQAQLARQRLQLVREAYGTAGPEFGNARQETITSAQRVIDLENERIRIAREQAQQTNQHLDEVNGQLAIGNALNRQSLSLLEQIAKNTSSGGGGGGGLLNFSDTARLANVV